MKELKTHSREFDNKIVKRLQASKTDRGELSDKTKRGVERSLDDIKAGRTLSMQEVKRRLKIE